MTAIAHLQSLESAAQALEVDLVTAQGKVDNFFVEGPGSNFANIEALEQFSAELDQFHMVFHFHELVRAETELAGQEFYNNPSSPGYGHTDPSSLLTALDGLITLEGQAHTLVDDLSGAQEARDTFFDVGAGAGFADSTEIGDRVAHLQAAQPIAAGLEDAADSAQGDVAAFFSGLNSDSALNLKDGSVYTVSGEIADEVAALETLLNGDNAVDNVTGFLESQERSIADLADLNGQIDNSVVMRDMPVSDATPQMVNLAPEEVDRLGEGSVQIEARQTDGVGNVHEGALPRATL